MFKGDAKRNRNRIIHVLVVATLVFIGISSTQTVLAESNEVTDPKYFEFNINTRTLTRYDTAGGSNVVIPSQIDEVVVEKIGQKLFYNAGLTAVVIPDSVQAVGEETFKGNKLTSIEIPDSVKEIGEKAFEINDLTSLKLGDSLNIADSSIERNFQEAPGEQNQVAGRYGSLDGEEGTTEKGAAEIEDDITGIWRVVSGDTNCEQMVIEEEIWIAWEDIYLMDGSLEFRTEMRNGSKTEEFEGGSSRTKLDKNVGRLRIYWNDNGVTYRLEGTFNSNHVIEGTVYKAKKEIGVWELQKH